MKVLFLCKANIFRSQMAEALFNKYSKNHRAESAALIQPEGKMHALVVRAIKEEEIDITNNISKKCDAKMLKEADVVVVMNSNLEKHFLKLKQNLKPGAIIHIWEIPDIKALETDEHFYPEVVNTRNMIKSRVLNLIKNLE
jgi:protein-tyrosine-phosphatase